ncbi:hypothetical protein JTB14_024078 [Gonioctena quinquepunctata]|nr:hypothetical protein JTB14_024078 [Gonioctena quinquepunctata]
MSAYIRVYDATSLETAEESKVCLGSQSGNNAPRSDDNVNIIDEKYVQKSEPDLNPDQARLEKCCIESFLAKTDALMNSDTEEEFINNNSEKSDSNEVSLSLYPSRPKNQEYYLQKWQARQIARGFVDNTINRVLETWAHPPFDATDFVENCENDGQVEDDAILMAIQSHGLRSSLQSSIHSPNSGFGRDIVPIKNPEIEESTKDNLENSQTELTKEYENTSSSSDTDMVSYESGNSSQEDGRNSDVCDPMDFLNAAVSVAIQKKGLSY